MRRLARLILPLLLLLTLLGCTQETTPSPSVAPSQTPAVEPSPRSFVLPRTASTLHPILGNDRTNLTLAPLLWEGLFELDHAFVPQNVLCEASSVSANGLVWTFSLRPGVTFSDGSPLTAQEVAASLTLAKSAQSRYAARLSQVTSVAAADSTTVTVTLSSPNGNLPALLDIPIVKGEGDSPLGTGPYLLEGEAETARLSLRADWWQDKPLPLSSIPLSLVTGTDQLIYAFDTQDISLVTADLTGTNALGFALGYEVWQCPSSIMLFVGFRCDKGACADAALRQALAKSFDRSTVASALYARHSTAAVLPVSPASKLYDTALAAQLDYSAQEAEARLTQAGYVLRDGQLLYQHKPVRLTFLVNNENSFKVATAEYLAGEIRKLGIEVDLQKRSWKDFEKALQEGAFDLYLGETMLTPDFDLTALLAKNGALNYGKYTGTETLDLLTSFRAAQDDQRTLAARRLYLALAEEMPFSVLCFKNQSVLTPWGMVSGLRPTQANAFYGLSNWVLSAEQ